jgi:3-oxoacyl-(acyl-carrier-protein) synthase/phosphopantetheinyl transferase
MTNDNDIAIVGMSCHLPGAYNIQEFWNNLVNGVDSITEVPEDRIVHQFFSNDKKTTADRFYFNKGGFLSPIKIDPIQYGILPIAAEGIDVEHLEALYLVKEALNDAGVFEKKIPLQKCCFILGKGNFTSIASYNVAEYVYHATYLQLIAKYLCPEVKEEELKKIKEEFQSKLGRYQADTAFGVMSNIVASLVANKHDMKGPAYTLDAACASSLIAVEHACNLLLSGQCDIALAGGMHLGQGASFWSVFNIIGAASYKGQIAPFSENADGLLIGEGVGILVLKKLDKAIADNDRIYAVIKAVSSSSDGSDVSVMAPSTKGQVETLKRTWEKSGMDPKKIGYVEAHGTATQVGDKVEIATLSEFFGDNSAPPVLLGSVKSNIGHAMPAAGIVGLIKTALALYNRKIPPTLHCEQPVKAMSNSRFQPAQQLTDWDEEKYPLVAGVNAFGFGGINAHAILEAYSNPNQTTVQNPNAKLFKDKVITLSAGTKEELLYKLEKEDYTVSEGNYRLVVFNPTAGKLDKAKTLIEKDKPWKGRLDIWFSNKPLLLEGGKVVFMFSGYDAGTEIETQSITDYFDIPYKQVVIGKDKLMGHAINHFYRSKLLDQALKRTGLTPDINIGHSLGEWHAAGAAGYVTPASIEKLIEQYNPENSLVVDVIYIAIGCGYSKIKPWCEEIHDLYLANDNCPNQILMAGKEESVNRLIQHLKEEQIFYQILPFQSGQHTPLFPEEEMKGLYSLYESILEFAEGKIPLWSSTTVDEYPKSKEEFYALFARHLREAVRFRELIEKLYEQEKARVFIQVGVGPLTGFVEDTLRDQPVGIISTIHPNNSGIEQLRRIAALLFIEGKTVNEEMLEITKATSKKQGRMLHTIGFSMPFINEFPALKEVITRYSNKQDTTFQDDTDFSSDDRDDDVLREAYDNLREIAALQNDIVKWYKSNRTGRVSRKAQSKVNINRAGSAVEKTVRLNLEDHLYLLDHVVVRQPDNRPLEESNPVVPFTMTVDLLCEYTQELVPGKKVLKVNSAGVYKWIPVNKPFVEKMSGHWITGDSVSWMLPGYAYGNVTLGDTYPAVPGEYSKEIDLGDNIIPVIPDKSQIYYYFMFHGPQYQTIINVTRLTKKGIQARVQNSEGKGSLLDSVGQLLGLYCNLIFEEGHVLFPMSVKEIIYYQDYQDKKGIFDFTMTITDVKDYEVTCNTVIKREGKVWCAVVGWLSRRMDYHRRGLNAVRVPKENILAERLNKNIFYYYNETGVSVSFLEFLYERYLNLEERKHYKSLYLNQARNYLISRVALKDGVRKYLQKGEKDDLIFPIEISVNYDEKGKPCLQGPEELKGIEISIAHKGSEAVAMVSGKPAGIDIEKIEIRNNEFMEMAFTPHELDLLKEKANEPEWIARFWVAKEAYGKMLGLGLQGNPKQYEIESINGEELTIKNTVIITAKHRTDYIIGWTK